MTAARSRLTALRLAAQRIAAPSAQSPVEAVRHSLAMQAQDFPGAKWSVGLRTPGSVDADVETALADRTIVRSWPMRGTLHLVAAEDLGWMLGITTPRLIRGAALRRKQLGLEDADIERARAVALDRLAGGGILQRRDLLAAFEEGGLSTSDQRGYHLLWTLAQTGTLVFGPVEGKQHTFALLDDWVPSPRVLDRDAALGEFALRYFTSHGPATVRDLAWWASLTLAEARTGLALVRDRLESLELEGVTYLLAPGLTPAPDGVHLLPGFDENLLGYHDRSAPLAAEHGERIVPGRNGVFKPTIVVNGEVVGTWSRSLSKAGLRVELLAFDSDVPDAAAAVERLRHFHGTAS